jgi:prolyl oligopeptidase
MNHPGDSVAQRGLGTARSLLALVIGFATVQVVLYGSLLLVMPELFRGADFPANGALVGLLIIEILAGAAGVFVAAILGGRAVTAHGWALGLIIMAFNLWVVTRPDSPWPLVPAIIVVAAVPLQTWAAVAVVEWLRSRPQPAKSIGTGSTGALILLAALTGYASVAAPQSAAAGVLGSDTLEAPALDAPLLREDTVRVAPPTGETETDRARVQGAFDAVKPGGTILFGPGTYLLGAGARLTVPDVTVLGHANGTVLRGCDPDAFEVEMLRIASVVFGCTGLYVQAERQTIRGLTFEYTWHGIVVGPYPTTEEEGAALQSSAASLPAPYPAGGQRIEGNTFRATPNGLRVLGTGNELSVVRDNDFIDVFHAIGIYGAPLHFVDNRVTVEEPGRVPFSRHPGSAIIVSPGQTDCDGHVVAGNRIEGYPDPIYVLVGRGETCRGVEIRDNTIYATRVKVPEAWSGYTPTEADSTMVGAPITLMNNTEPMEGISEADSDGILENILVQGNRVLGAEGLGILVQNASNSRIAGNIISGIERRDPFPGITWDGFEQRWEAANGSAIWISPGSDRNEIVGNTFEDIAGDAIVLEGESNRVEVQGAGVALRDLGRGNRVLAPTDSIGRPVEVAGARAPVGQEARGNHEAGSETERVTATLPTRCSGSPGQVRRLDTEPDDRPYLWLEDLCADSVLRWTDARATRTLEHYSSIPIHDSIMAEIHAAREASRLVVLNDVPVPAIRSGPYADRFAGGVWMRQPVERGESGEDAWEEVLDLDSLSRAEGTSFAIASAECLAPEYARCLLLLSRGGGTRTFDLREYDVDTRTFVEDGFALGPGHTSVFWRDANSIHIATSPMGRPDQVLIWHRGRPLDEADVVFRTDTSESGRTAEPRGDQGVVVERRADHLLLLNIRHQYDIEYHLVAGDEPVHLPVPRDVVDVMIVDGQLVLQLRSAWQPDDVVFSSGSLIGIDLEDLLGGSRAFRSIMHSDRDLVVDAIWSTPALLLVRALVDVKPRLFEFRHRGGDWERRRIDVPEQGRVDVQNVSRWSDTYYFTHEDFLTPRTAFMRNDSGAVVLARRASPSFPAEGFRVDQWHATSADGTRVPYFIVREENMALDGRNPVIVYGYGGNGLSILPEYLSLHGPAWLMRGGVYVLANIRGGNEFGPEWHDAVRREKRQGAFDDFQAVAQDLVDRNVTSPGMIGSYGGSNGGILVGMSLVQRPDLFGAVWVNNGVLELHRCSQLSGVPPVGERGDGQDLNDWAYMRHYSPFHNLVAGQIYPPVLLTANRSDDIVHPCHSRKFTARMEALGYRNVSYYETEEGGHGKAYSPREQAMIMSFFLHNLHPGYKDER